MTECSVYVIGFDSDKGPSKVGIARDPAKRMTALQTAHHQRLVLTGWWLCPNRGIARDLELAFHDTQSDTRLAGEWFDISPNESMLILKIGLGVMLNTLGRFEPHEVDEILKVSRRG